jgi:hypothetical protein
MGNQNEINEAKSTIELQNNQNKILQDKIRDLEFKLAIAES